MTKERYNKLMDDLNLSISKEEWDEGWHFCSDWDFLLVGPDTPLEKESCTCVFEPEELNENTRN